MNSVLRRGTRAGESLQKDDGHKKHKEAQKLNWAMQSGFLFCAVSCCGFRLSTPWRFDSNAATVVESRDTRAGQEIGGTLIRTDLR